MQRLGGIFSFNVNAIQTQKMICDQFINELKLLLLTARTAMSRFLAITLCLIHGSVRAVSGSRFFSPLMAIIKLKKNNLW